MPNLWAVLLYHKYVSVTLLQIDIDPGLCLARMRSFHDQISYASGAYPLCNIVYGARFLFDARHWLSETR